MFLKIRLKINKFIRNNRGKILLVVIIFLIIMLINYFLGHRKKELELNTTYNPHEVLLSDTGETVPEKLQEPIEKLIDNFINYCNEKDFESAYNLITDECKQNEFNNSIDEFKKYVEEVFPNKKIYSIQSYSNTENYYIYNVKILNDILASGLTDEEYYYYEEKYAIKQEGDNLKLNVANYMGKEDLKRVAEDDYVKIRIIQKLMYYSREIYKVKITNKTENIMVLADGYEGDEIMLNLGKQTRGVENNDLYMVLEPGETAEYDLYFGKYYDESSNTESIVFNKIRILNSYTGKNGTKQEEIENAIKLYCLEIPLN